MGVFVALAGIRPSYGARREEILDGEGGRGRRERTSLPFSLPFSPFSPETHDTQARVFVKSKSASNDQRREGA